jgi:hypothetical protein
MILETDHELWSPQHSTWEHFFKEFRASLASRGQRFAVIANQYGSFMAKKFEKGETLVRFLGCRNEDKYISDPCAELNY